jgi:hypothetical protein
MFVVEFPGSGDPGYMVGLLQSKPFGYCMISGLAPDR